HVDQQIMELQGEPQQRAAAPRRGQTVRPVPFQAPGGLLAAPSAAVGGPLPPDYRRGGGKPSKPLRGIGHSGVTGWSSTRRGNPLARNKSRPGRVLLPRARRHVQCRSTAPRCEGPSTKCPPCAQPYQSGDDPIRRRSTRPGCEGPGTTLPP